MLQTRYIAAATLLALGCGARQKAPDEPIGDEPFVDEIDVVGNQAFSDDALIDGLGSREPRGWIRRRRTRFDPAMVEKDRARLEAYYARRGFFDAFVEDVKTTRDGREVELTFAINEGAPSTTSEIRIDGLPEGGAIGHEQLLGKLEIAVGSRFDYGDYDAGKRKLLVALLQAGYARARVDGRAEADRERRRVVLHYSVDPGPIVRVGDIAVRGLRTMPASVVRNRLAFKSGQIFHPRAVARSQQKIRALGRFGVVRVEFVDEERTPVSDVAVTVSEGPRREVRLGGGLGLDDTHFEIRGRAGYTLHGFLDPLVTLTTDARPAYTFIRGDASKNAPAIDVSAELTRTDLFLPLLTGKASLGFGTSVLEAYSTYGSKARIGLSRPLWRDRVQLSLGWRYAVLDLIDVDPAIDEVLGERLGFFDDPYLLAAFDQVLSLDLRDNPLNARNGVYVELRLQEAGPYAGGEFSYVKLIPEARAFQAFGDRLGIAGRVRWGKALAGTLPITERFLAGGASSQRGFSQRQLSPVAGDVETSNVGIGGDEIVETSGELRLGLVKLGGNFLGVVGFIDAADVVDDGGSIDVTNLHVATGGGLRYQTPVGPLRIDVGYRLNRAGAGELQAGDRWALHLSIGEAF